MRTDGRSDRAWAVLGTSSGYPSRVRVRAWGYAGEPPTTAQLPDFKLRRVSCQKFGGRDLASRIWVTDIPLESGYGC